MKNSPGGEDGIMLELFIFIDITGLKFRNETNVFSIAGKSGSSPFPPHQTRWFKSGSAEPIKAL